MPTLPPSTIPLIPPGQLFERLTTDTTIGIRWLVAADPVFFESLNRPIVDVTVRQLIIAKTLDQLNLRLGHASLFPFLVPPKLESGSSALIDLPLSWIWDLHASLPQKWEFVRLAKIKRLSGTNGGSFTEYTGKIRFVFTAQVKGSISEVAVFTADYQIDSPLSFQINRIQAPATGEEPVVISSVEALTIDGFIEFRTLDASDPSVQSFFDVLVPPGLGSAETPEPPTSFDIADTPAGGGSVTNDYSLSAVSHGTGLLTASAFNLIPNLESDPNIWIEAFNFPFRLGASRMSATPASSPITVPKTLFTEFDICTPCGDQPTGDISGKYSPVWINRIIRQDNSADELKFVLATFNVTTDQQSTVPVEFAELVLGRSMAAGTVVEIKPIDDLLLAAGSGESKFRQGFGRGHVVLSSKWGGSTSEIGDFFDSFIPIIDEPPAAIFTQESTTISPFGVSRSSRNTPTDGQAEALIGTTARRLTPIHPSDTNRFVTEQDQGKGDAVDFSDAATGLPPAKRENVDIERFGFKGGLVQKLITLVVNSSGTSHNYESDIEPRLTILLGRKPLMGDMWWDGTRIKYFIEISSDQPGVWVS